MSNNAQNTRVALFGHFGELMGSYTGAEGHWPTPTASRVFVHGVGYSEKSRIQPTVTTNVVPGEEPVNPRSAAGLTNKSYQRFSNMTSSSAKTKTSQILTAPSSSVHIVPRTYTEEETQKIEALREYADSLRLPETDPYYPWEARWLADKGCAERYMRAAKFKLDDAKRRIAGTLEWRREFKPELIPPEDVRVESETGKIILNGFDINGRPIITMHPGRENTKTSDRQLRHLIYVLERAIDLMPSGQDSLVIIVDYRSTTLRTNPSISVAAKVLTILQHHYVERLGRAIVVHLPFILQFFYKGISPFLDPITRDKMRFNPDLKELIPDDHLDAELGGSYAYEFDPDIYWDSLIKACHIAPDGGRLSPHPLGTSSTTKSESTNIHSPSTSSRSSDDDDDGALEPRTPANGIWLDQGTRASTIKVDQEPYTKSNATDNDASVTIVPVQ